MNANGELHPLMDRRVSLGMSRAQLARRMQVTWVTVYRWETLKVSPDRLTVREWERVLREEERRVS
jgi:ribosome-binding protein aMBF1 (putative translation factor)